MAWSGWIELENRTVNSFGTGNRSHFLLYTKYRYNRSGTTVNYEIYSDLSYINDYGGSNSGTYNYPLGIKINFNNTGDSGYVQVSSGGTWVHGALIGSYTWSKSITNTTGSGTIPLKTYANNMSTGSFDNPGWFSHNLTIPVLDNFTQAPTLTCTSVTETTMNFSWSTSETCSQAILYKNGTAVQTKSSLNATSGSFDIVTGLTANTSYQWYVKCTKKDSGGNTRDSSTLSKSTYAYPSIASVGTNQITIPEHGQSVSQSVTLNNQLSRSVTVTATVWDGTGTAHQVASATTTGTSVNLSLAANTLYDNIPNTATSGNIRYRCTYSGNDSDLTKTWVTSSSYCGPTVSGNPTYTNTNSTHSGLVGPDTIIQGKSSFSVTSPTVTPRGNASIKNYYFKIGNGSYENNGTSTTKTYSSTSLSGDSVMASCYAEDSRGYTSTVKQVSMRILAYSEPSANITVKRDGTGYTTSATINLISATRSKLSTSGATGTDVNNWRGNPSSNKISVSITSGPTLSASVIGTTNYTMSDKKVYITNASLANSYTVTINISDRITTNKTLTFTLDKASPILSLLNTNRVGVNKMDPSCALDVNGDAKVSGSLTVNNASVLTSIPTASSSVLGGIKVGSNLSISNGVLSGSYSTATQSANGLMSSGDKTKLDGIANNANNYSLPTASSSTKGGIKVGNNLSISNEVLSMSPTNLYNNTDGSNTSVTLSSSAANFTYLDIFYKGASYYNCTRVYSPNGKYISLMSNTNGNYADLVVQMSFATAYISGTTITISNQAMINFSNTNGNYNWKASNTYIVRVDGYK